MEPPVLLLDGYNLLNADPNLKQYMGVSDTLRFARAELERRVQVCGGGWGGLGGREGVGVDAREAGSVKRHPEVCTRRVGAGVLGRGGEEEGARRAGRSGAMQAFFRSICSPRLSSQGCEPSLPLDRFAPVS